MSPLPILSDPAPEIPREPRWGRPLVVPPGGGSRRSYTRATTFVGSIEDRMALGRWQQRMTALGLADNAHLRLAVAAARNNKGRLDALCEEALEAAKGKAAATTGTALHSLTEQIDRGFDPPFPEDYAADLNAYVAATRDLTALYIEQFLVQDPLEVGGTPDRIVEYEGTRYIADLKTGSIEYGHLTIAAQLAMYARSRPYDTRTDERMEPHGADLARGIVIHLPAGQGVCTLYWVDLAQGWEAVRLCRDVRAARRLSFPQLMRELKPVRDAPLGLDTQIAVASSRDEVTALWQAHENEWTDHLTDLARRRIAALAGSTAPATATASATERTPA